MASKSSALRDEILQLPPSERLKLVEEIWDSLAVTPENVPIPDWHKEELDRRLDDPAPGPGETWEQVRAKLRKRS
jgi:putative addiction module component (TIGR02574 family)